MRKLFVASLVLVLFVPLVVLGGYGVTAPCVAGPCGGGGSGGSKGGNAGGNANGHGSTLIVQESVIVSVEVISRVMNTIPVVHVVTHFEPPDPCVNSCLSAVSPTSFNAGFYGLLVSAVGMLGLAGYFTMGSGTGGAGGGAGAGKGTHAPGHRDARKSSNEFDSVTDSHQVVTQGGGNQSGVGGGSAVSILQQLQQMMGGGGSGTGESAQGLIQQLMGMLGSPAGGGSQTSAQAIIQQLMNMLGSTGGSSDPGSSAQALLNQLMGMVGGGTASSSGTGTSAQSLIQQLMGMLGGGAGSTSSTGGSTGLGDMSNSSQFQLQQAMDQKTQIESTFSNALKALLDTLKNIVGNLKG